MRHSCHAIPIGGLRLGLTHGMKRRIGLGITGPGVDDESDKRRGAGRHCGRRYGGLDGRRGPDSSPFGTMLGPPDRIRGDRCRRRRRGHAAPYPLLQRTAGNPRGGVHGAHPCHLQTGYRISRLGPNRRQLYPPLRHVRARRGGDRFPPLLVAVGTRGAGSAAAGPAILCLHPSAGGAVRASRSGPGRPEFHLRLCLSIRCAVVRALSAQPGRGSGRGADRGHGRRCRAGRRERADPFGHAGRWRAGRGRPVHRLLGLSLAAARPDAGRAVRGLVAMAADRPCGRHAVPDRNRRHPLYQRDRHARRLALAHPAPASHRQWLCLCQRLHRRRRCRPRAGAGGGGRETGRAAAAALQGGAAAAQLGRQLRRGGPSQRVPGTARIDQHLSGATGYHRANRTVPRPPDGGVRPGRIQPGHRSGI